MKTLKASYDYNNDCQSVMIDHSVLDQFLLTREGNPLEKIFVLPFFRLLIQENQAVRTS